MNYLDLFSGIGGFRLGLEQAGFKFKWEGHSEIDKYAEQIYHKHFPESECLGDVKTIKTDSLPRINLITFGFPCQDISIAGKRGGLRASRSGLFFEAMRIIKATEPDIFIFENVKGLFSSNEGRDFEVILRTVADIGLYDCEWQLLNTRWFLPQNRERIYFIGHLRGRSEPKVFPIGETNSIYPQEYKEDNSSQCVNCLDSNYHKGWLDHGQRTMIFLGGVMGDKNKKWLEDGKDNSRNFPQGQRVYSPEGDACQLTSQGGGWGAKTGLYEVAQALQTDGMLYQGSSFGTNIPQSQRAIRRLTPVECERLQGFPDGYTEGLSDTQRYKCLGNAVSVPVVKAIGRKLNL